MKKIAVVLMFCFSMLAGVPTLQADPIDLSGFTAFPNDLLTQYPSSIQVTATGITFTETETNVYISLYNDAFAVPSLANRLTFDFLLTPGENGGMDHLGFILSDGLGIDVRIDLNELGPAGHFSADLSPFRGTSISLEWFLEDGGPVTLGSVGIISNIDLETGGTPVPEPSTLLALISGLGGLFLLRRRLFGK